jgi:sugar lactone lactonase YvrE
MNESRLTQLLDEATRSEPLLGPVVSASMRAGDRLRRRRRIRAVATVAALVAGAVTVPAFALQAGEVSSAPAAGGRTGTAFIATSRDTIVRVDLATGQTSRPIRVPTIPVADFPLVAAPGGRTIWVTGSAGLLTPISVRAPRAGPPVRLRSGAAPAGQPLAAVITDHGARAYVALSPHGVLAVNLATRKVLASINVQYPETLAASPDGKLIFVNANGGLTVISTRTNTVLRTIKWHPPGLWAVTAVGDKTVYALATSAVGLKAASYDTVLVRVSTATGATRTFVIRNTFSDAVAPNGSLLYAAGPTALWAVSPATGKTVARWPLALKNANSLAISPDGTTAYILGYLSGRGLRAVLVKVNLRTGQIVRRVHVPHFISPYPGALMVSPDGRTVYAEMYKTVTLEYAIAFDARSGRIVASTAMRPHDAPEGAPDSVAFGR